LDQLPSDTKQTNKKLRGLLIVSDKRIGSEIPRWCTNCMSPQPFAGGIEKKFKGGLRYRWICKKCVEKRGFKND
jgi:hypothetical protein